jgi:uncharacterized membrane protein
MGFAIAALALVVSLWAWPSLPPRIPTHWNLDGVVDGYSSRLAGAFGLPLGIVVLRLLLALLPNIDPLRANYERFRDTYWLVINGILLFVAVVHGMVIANALGYLVNPNTVFPVALAILLILLGNVLTRLAPNWFLGIRTPWTLSDEYVWRKTHRVGGWLMVLGGLAILAAALVARPFAVKMVFVVVVGIAVWSLIYSYVLWRGRRETRT